MYTPCAVIGAISAEVTQSGSGDLCTGGFQQLKNCKESEFVQRFYFDNSMQKCVEYATCPSDTVLSNVFDSMESCQDSCGEHTRECAQSTLISIHPLKSALSVMRNRYTCFFSFYSGGCQLS